MFITHIHPDHTGGLMNGNTKVFPNATIHINKREVDYWFNKSIAATAVEPQKTPDSAPSRLTATLRA